MPSFIINNCSTEIIKTNGADLLPACCRGCPIEHLDKIEAPVGTTFFFTYVADVSPDIVNDDTGEIIKGKDVWSPDIIFKDIRIPIGTRVQIIIEEEPINFYMDTVEVI